MAVSHRHLIRTSTWTAGQAHTPGQVHHSLTPVQYFCHPQGAEESSYKQDVPDINFSQIHTLGQDSHQAQEVSVYQTYPLGTQEPRGAYQTYSGHDRYQAYEREHGPYLPHEPGYGLYQPGYGPYDDQTPDPEHRMLACQNAKAYLLKSSVTSGLNL